MGLEDIEQETALVIAELVRNKKFKGLMIGGKSGDKAKKDNRITLTQAKKAIEWRLNRHLHNYHLTDGRFQTIPLANEDDSGNPTLVDLELTKQFFHNKNDYLSNPYDLIISTFQFSNLKRTLSPRDYKICERRFKNQETLDEIGQSLHLTRERVRQILHNILRTLKLRLHDKHKATDRKITNSC